VTRLSWIFLFLTVGLTVAGQLLVKWGIVQTGASPERLLLLPRFVLKAFSNVYVLLGLGCAVAAAACWTVAVSRADLSVAYPFMGLGIVLVLALSGVIFGETVPLHRWLGVLIVCLGLIVASRR
jgi:multidrug transporter EmrE-like cation transporter